MCFVSSTLGAKRMKHLFGIVFAMYFYFYFSIYGTLFARYLFLVLALYLLPLQLRPNLNYIFIFISVFLAWNLRGMFLILFIFWHEICEVLRCRYFPASKCRYFPAPVKMAVQVFSCIDVIAIWSQSLEDVQLRFGLNRT